MEEIKELLSKAKNVYPEYDQVIIYLADTSDPDIKVPYIVGITEISYEPDDWTYIISVDDFITQYF